MLTRLDAPIQQGKRIFQRLPKNPMDKCTIVSIYPRAIEENKPTIFPQNYRIEAAPRGGFSLLVVDGASYFTQPMMEGQPPNEIQINAAQLADSIVKDFLNSIWLSNSGGRGPGLFFIPGEYTEKTILTAKDYNGKTFNELMEVAKARQKAWFTELMNAADELWARTNGNPRAVPDDARLAAIELGVEKSKPWMENTVAAQLDRCPACGEMVDLNYPVCKGCKAVINKKKAEELGLIFAK